MKTWLSKKKRQNNIGYVPSICYGLKQIMIACIKWRKSGSELKDKHLYIYIEIILKELKPSFAWCKISALPHSEVVLNLSCQDQRAVLFQKKRVDSNQVRSR